MNIVKQLALQIPGMKALQHRHWRRDAARKLQSQSPSEVFSEIYQKNGWSGKQSRSGTGSDPSQTQKLKQLLPQLFRQFEIASMLDIPCGDFQWMKDVSLDNIQYLGADIVPAIVEQNKAQFESEWRHFVTLNLIQDLIPKVDLIFCRDCLVHLSHDDVIRSLNNIRTSESEYLLTTTFPDRTINEDILTGQWRVLNMELPPFNFPAPIELINEQCTEGDGFYRDKSLGLWRIDDLPITLNANKRDRIAQ